MAAAPAATREAQDVCDRRRQRELLADTARGDGSGSAEGLPR